jgi:uncharacterized protein (TIGR00725 family)
MGAGDRASAEEIRLAETLGRQIAERGWVLLTGGRAAGVMQAASRGAKQVAGSLVVGVLPGASGDAAPEVDVAIFTGMGNARNSINVLSSDVVIACGVSGPGTASEVALALKSSRPVVLLAASQQACAYFQTLRPAPYIATSVEQAIEIAAALVAGRADD